MAADSNLLDLLIAVDRLLDVASQAQVIRDRLIKNARKEVQEAEQHGLPPPGQESLRPQEAGR